MGGEIVAVTPDDPADIKAAAEKHGIEFPWLSDAETKVIEKFGLLHRDALPGKDAARPAVVFVRADGTISGTIQTENYRFHAPGDAMMEGFRHARGEPVTSP